MMKIGIANDHAGYLLKTAVAAHLREFGFDVTDFGTDSEQSVDYPDFAHPLARAVEQGTCEVGIAICGSGNGINMTVNKHSGIRSALCWLPEIGRLARAHNNANICALPARFIDKAVALQIVDVFLSTPFEGGRHQTRIDKIPL